MQFRLNQLAFALFMSCAINTSAKVLYVDLNSPNPRSPYTNWIAAATNIQDAVDLAINGDLVLVTNGLYRTGGRVIYGGMTNRVAVTKPITIQSVSGPAFTIIEGHQMPGAPNGDSAVRCVYLTNGAALVGFTITNGATRASGDQLKEESAGGVWCPSTSATISNCIIIANSASQEGGGVCYGTLYGCSFMCNTGVYGGATYYSTLKNCALTGNSAIYGGGTYYGTLVNCTLTGNSAVQGGGTYYGSLTNCIIYYNQATLSSNSMGGTLRYCCTAPSATGAGNLQTEPQLTSLSHIGFSSPCRSAGAPSTATGLDIDGEAWSDPPSIGCDEYHAAAVVGSIMPTIQSPYTNVVSEITIPFVANATGQTSYSVWDFGDGTLATNRAYICHSWITPGDYPVLLKMYNETYANGIITTTVVHVVTQIVHYVALGNITPMPPFSSWNAAASNIQDAVDAATTAGALILVSNGVYGVGGRIVYGTRTNRVVLTKPVVLRSFNGPTVTAIQGYQIYGGLNGKSAVRCVYLGDGAVLDGFTLMNWATGDTPNTWFVDEMCGGGVWCASYGASVSNCIFSGNAAYNYGGAAAYGTLKNCIIVSNSASCGGGVYYSTLNNCLLKGNKAEVGGGSYFGTLINSLVTSNVSTGGYLGQGGGGAFCGTLNNCTVTGNVASGWQGDGGGAYYCSLNNCVIYYNSLYWTGGAATGSNYYTGSLNYCCTSPLPPSGSGNLTNAPLFVDQIGSNLRLACTSPCIGAGNNSYAVGATDLDGRPRLIGGTIDVGAYEFQPSISGLFIGWLQQYGFPTDGSADYSSGTGSLLK